ncbi:hypothetical protein JCM31598_27560 [Desulfonatronum parangueonense]
MAKGINSAIVNPKSLGFSKKPPILNIPRSEMPILFIAQYIPYKDEITPKKRRVQKTKITWDLDCTTYAKRKKGIIV